MGPASPVARDTDLSVPLHSRGKFELKYRRIKFDDQAFSRSRHKHDKYTINKHDKYTNHDKYTIFFV